MRLRTAFVLLSSIVVAGSLTQKFIAPKNQALAHTVQEAELSSVKKLVRSFMTKNEVSGVAISLVKGSSHEELYFGDLGNQDKTPVTVKSLFEIGSVAKVITSHLLLLAQAEGKLTIDDPVAKHLPVLQANPVFSAITLKDLAQHISSLPATKKSPKHLKNKDEFMQWLLHWQPTIAPKTQYLYSNVGITLLGFALEAIYQQDWDKIVTEKILAPRQMASTFRFVPQELLPHFAQGFKSHQQAVSPLPKDWLYYPAADLKATASNLGSYIASWDDSYFATLKESVCFTNRSCQGLGIEIHPLAELAKSWSNTRFNYESTMDATVQNNVRLPALNHLFIDKTGSSDGMSSYIAMIPSSRVGVAILCNKYNVLERVSLGRSIVALLANKKPSLH